MAGVRIPDVTWGRGGGRDNVKCERDAAVLIFEGENKDRRHPHIASGNGDEKYVCGLKVRRERVVLVASRHRWTRTDKAHSLWDFVLTLLVFSVRASEAVSSCARHKTFNQVY